MTDTEERTIKIKIRTTVATTKRICDSCGETETEIVETFRRKSVKPKTELGKKCVKMVNARYRLKQINAQHRSRFKTCKLCEKEICEKCSTYAYDYRVGSWDVDEVLFSRFYCPECQKKYLELQEKLKAPWSTRSDWDERYKWIEKAVFNILVADRAKPGYAERFWGNVT